MLGRISGFLSMPQWLVMALTVGALAGAGIGWTANGWRLGADIAAIKADAATARAVAATTALKDLEAGVKRVNDAAAAAQLDVSTINGKLDAIRRDYKNAKAPVLPPDCRPGTIRVQSLAAATAAVDEAIARPKPGGAVQP